MGYAYPELLEFLLVETVQVLLFLVVRAGVLQVESGDMVLYSDLGTHPGAPLLGNYDNLYGVI